MSEYKDQQQYESRMIAQSMVTTELPWFTHEYFDNRRDLAGSTRLEYCYILREFFDYICYFDGRFVDKGVLGLELSDMKLLKKDDINDYLNWKESHKIHEGEWNEEVIGVSPATIKRIRSCLVSFFNSFVEENKLDNNPVVGIKAPKLPERDPISLNKEEKQRLLSCIKNGTGLTGNALLNHANSVERDYAIAYVFLHTGVRISELVGMDIRDIDFYTHSIRIYRKGNKEQEVFFSDSCEEALNEYLEVRHSKFTPRDDQALFLNKYGERITERSVERMIKKYVEIALPNRRKITPHKLRSTYATDMLNATGDIELVSKQLGHAHVSTTQIYAKSAKEARADVRNMIE